MILATNNYDPEADEGRRKPSHVTGKELRVYLIIGAILVIILFPVYLRLMDLRNSHLCIQNLQAIGTSMNLYAVDNNDRLPPLYEATPEGMPILYHKDRVFSWVSLLSRYMQARASFEDPGADPSEEVTNENGVAGGPLLSGYGMFGALAAEPLGSMSSLSTTAMIGCSSNEGANGTYDPLPFKDADGKRLPDGFVIGFDTTNFTANDSTASNFRKAKFATRLAFPDSATKGFVKAGKSRHPDGVHLLMADTHIRYAAPLDSAIRHQGKSSTTTGYWEVP